MTQSGTPLPSRRRKSFVAFGLVIVLSITGFQLWRNMQGDAPVLDAYRDYLLRVSAQSPAAQEYLEKYQTKHARQSVASRHFQTVCANVTTLAEREGVDPDKISPKLAEDCRSLMHRVTLGNLP